MSITEEKTTTAILDQCFDHFRRYGVKSMSMDDIAGKFGISKKTLYLQFENKKDLIFRAVSRHSVLKQELINSITEQANDAVDEMVQLAEHTVLEFRQIKPILIYDLQKYYREIWNFVMSSQHEFFIKQMSNNLKRGIMEGFYRTSIDPDIVAKLYVSKTISLVNEELFSLVDYKREHLLRQHLTYHIYGILSNKGREHFEQFNLFND